MEFAPVGSSPARPRVGEGFPTRTALLAAGLALSLGLAPLTAHAGPDDCEPGNGGAVATCRGDQSQGVRNLGADPDFASPPVHTLQVKDLTAPIAPSGGTEGILFENTAGGNIVLRSGESDQPVAIETDGAIGIHATSRGTPVQPNPPRDLLLHLPVPGGPAVSGGTIDVETWGDVSTQGDDSHAIEARSDTTGFPKSVTQELSQALADIEEIESKIDFSVLSVAGEESKVGEQVAGMRIDSDGDSPPATAGAFTIEEDGSLSFSLGSDFDDLGPGESRSTAVAYELLAYSGITDQTQVTPGLVVVTVTRTESGLEEAREAYVGTYGVSERPQTDNTVLPDLERFVDGLLADAGAGGSGNGIHITSRGVLETHGGESHGILASSQGGQGARGRNGSISHSADPGGVGKPGGKVTVEAHGSIATHGEYSAGIVTHSRAGKGGQGGHGGTWRHGQRGGTGGGGGPLEVSGSASIETSGNDASGILALSEGGNGGNGGSGEFVTPGGRGGAGGQGGNVNVEGSWNITTGREGAAGGDRAHGIWARSVGGTAGEGGSGGWLAGSPGGGGQSADGGEVTVSSAGAIETWGDDAYGIHAQSVGGFGGKGGAARSLFYSAGGDGGSAGSGQKVMVDNEESGSIWTHGADSHAIFAQSVGGGGGSGGGAVGLVSVGGEGAYGGHGGRVEVTNDGSIHTFGSDARGVYAQSVGGQGGDGGAARGLAGIGGGGSGTSDGGSVEVTNRGSITTEGTTDVGGSDANFAQIGAHAIFAQSIGGGGGNGGFSAGLVAIGGRGGGGGDGASVSIGNEGVITTRGDGASGVFAQSIGGGGGNGGGAVSMGGPLTVSIGGEGADGGKAGTVEIVSGPEASIHTGGDYAYGIYAESLGGGGGSGGFAISGSFPSGSPVSLNLAIGGQGGGGGDGNTVDVKGSGDVTTSGTGSHGIYAQSTGGGGGSGGFAVAGSYGSVVTLNLALGGKGDTGGDGSTVRVGTESEPLAASIETSGEGAAGILAQSVGGGGGSGGWSLAGSALSGTGLNLSLGGSGAGGGQGGDVEIHASGSVTTALDGSHAIAAQSIGGGGGKGGLAGAASYGGGTRLNLGFGGSGGSGSSGGVVTVGSREVPLASELTTSGERAYGILAQSIGGGGGDGGFAVSGQFLGGSSIGLSFGGDAGAGGTGGSVAVHSASGITTGGEASHGIVAQSVGGGGGTGGSSLTAAVTAFGGAAVSVGGDGGSGNRSDRVDVVNAGEIETLEAHSHGIVGQSIGGGGGNGGAAGSAMVNFSSLIPVPAKFPTGSINVATSVGGDGGVGGAGDAVRIENTGRVTTHGDQSYGLVAQSVGGGGGDGGRAIAATGNISAPVPSDPSKPQLEIQVDFALAIGGRGGDGGPAGEVEVENEGGVETSGDTSHGIFAQSVGGGGGVGGNARALTVGIDPSNSVGAEELAGMLEQNPDPLSFSKTVNIAVGGDGGDGNHGGTVSVLNRERIFTDGADAYGIFAQSIGGGGGAGGGGFHGLDWADLGVPEELVPLFETAPGLSWIQDVEGCDPIHCPLNTDASVVVGGRGGSGGDGKGVDVTNEGEIETTGDGAFGALAQSIGGGGGIGGVGARGTGTVGIGGSGGAAGDGGAVGIAIDGNVTTGGKAAHGVIAQSIGGGGGIAGNVDGGIAESGINVGIRRSGGNAGDGGDVDVAVTGDITTWGSGASGILAQSIGGGGGLVGDLGASTLGFAGSVGGDGAGGAVNVVHRGNVTTSGERSHGIFAQSAGGEQDFVQQQLVTLGDDGKVVIGLPPIFRALEDRADVGGPVSVTSTGDITAPGLDSNGIQAQSVGDDGAESVAVTILGGTVRGGTGSGAAVRIEDGDKNTVLNRGTLTSVEEIEGRAIVAGAGDESVANEGTVTGDVDLGAGSDAFENREEGTFNAGRSVALGSGTAERLTNRGTLAPGGRRAEVLTTALTGAFQQAASGVFAWDLDVAAREADRLEATGPAQLGGRAEVEFVHMSLFHDGDAWDVLTASEIGSGFDEVALPPDSALMSWSHDYVSEATRDVFRVQISVDPFVAAAGTRLHRAVAAYLDEIAPQASDDLKAVLGTFQVAVSPDQAGRAFSSLSPDLHDGTTIAGVDTTRQQMRGLERHMADARTRRHLGIPAQKLASLRLAMAGSSAEVLRLAGNFEGTRAAVEPSRTTLWVDGLGQFGDQKSGQGFTGFDYQMGGALLGIDRAFGERFLAGLGAGYSYSDVEFDAGSGDVDIDAVNVSLYGTWFTRRAYLEGSLSYSWQGHESRRNVLVDGLSREARSDHDADIFGAQLGAGYRFAAADFNVEPFFSLSYVLFDEEGFREEGAGGANLEMAGRTTHSLVSELGVRVARSFGSEFGRVVPYVSGAWKYDYDVDDRRLVSGLAGAPGTRFSVDGHDLDASAGMVGTGLMLVRERASVSLEYLGEFRGDYVAHGVFGRVGFAF